jgi:FKBP-type peptidyl-prolyl cis-trans isomerase 2
MVEKTGERQLTATIQHLKKVTLALYAGKNIDEPANLEFIYGIASTGLCPFENALYDKGEGESLNFTIPASESYEFFGHHFLPLRQALGLQIMPEKIVLKVEIIAVADADNREVVQSLAKAQSGCGHGGSCGCGC